MTKFKFETRPNRYYRTCHVEVEVDWEDCVQEAGYANVMHYMHDGESTDELVAWLKALPEESKASVLKALTEEVKE